VGDDRWVPPAGPTSQRAAAAKGQGDAAAGAAAGLARLGRGPLGQEGRGEGCGVGWPGAGLKLKQAEIEGGERKPLFFL
jgi:hypothetical protein